MYLLAPARAHTQRIDCDHLHCPCCSSSSLHAIPLLVLCSFFSGSLTRLVLAQHQSSISLCIINPLAAFSSPVASVLQFPLLHKQKSPPSHPVSRHLNPSPSTSSRPRVHHGEHYMVHASRRFDPLALQCAHEPDVTFTSYVLELHTHTSTTAGLHLEDAQQPDQRPSASTTIH